MTDIMFTRTALAEAAKGAGVTTDQARTILEAAGVTVQPALPTDPESVIIATEVRGVTGKWRMILAPDGDWFSPAKINGAWWHQPEHITAWIETVVLPVTAAPVTLTEDQVGAQHAAPAEGEPIDLGDVREGDRVRVVLKDGDAATFTFTVRTVSTYHLCSSENAYSRDNIRSVRLLHREGEA